MQTLLPADSLRLGALNSRVEMVRLAVVLAALTRMIPPLRQWRGTVDLLFRSLMLCCAGWFEAWRLLVFGGVWESFAGDVTIESISGSTAIFGVCLFALGRESAFWRCIRTPAW